MEYAALIVSALLENEDDIDLDVGDVVQSGLYRIWWEWNDSYGEAQQIVEDPPVPYVDTEERPKPRLFLRIQSHIPRFSGYISFDFHAPSEIEPEDTWGSVHVTITNDIGYGTSYAEASAHHFTLPLKDWPTLKRLCVEFLSNTVRRTFQEEPISKSTGKAMSAQGLKFKIKARFRKLMAALEQHQMAVQNTPEMKALRKAQKEFEEEYLAASEAGVYGTEHDHAKDPEAEGLPTDFKKMTLADIAKWREILKRYARGSAGTPGASSETPPPQV